MRLSIRTVLLIALVGLQLGTVGIALTSSYLRSDIAVHDHARAIMTDTAESTVRSINTFLSPAKTAVELAKSLQQENIISETNKPKLERYFFEHLRTSPQISGFYYGDNAGRFIYVSRSSDVAEAQFRTKVVLGEDAGASLMYRNDAFERITSKVDPEDRYDPRARPWYQLALDKAGTVWTDPYIFYTSQKPGITVAAPVFDADGVIKGVMGIDMEIAAISDFLTNLKIGNSGRVLVLGTNGDVIAHPDKRNIKRMVENGNASLSFANIGEIDDPVAVAATNSFDKPFSEVDLSREQFARFDLDGVTHDAMFSPIEIGNLRWTIAIHVPEKDFLGGLLHNKKQIFAFAIAIGAMTILIGWLIARSITQPLTALSNCADQIARGERPDTAHLPTNFAELDHVSTAFRRMMRSQDRYHENNERMTGELVAWSRELEARVEERTSELQDTNALLRTEIGERAEVEQNLDREIERHNETTIDLKWALEEAHSASAAKTRFLSSMSHELRTPLNAIVGFGQMLDGHAGPISEAQSTEYTGYILDSGERLLGMINQVLDLAGIEAGNTLLSIEAISVNRVIQRVINEVEVLAQQRSITLVNEFDTSKPLYVNADQSRMTQALINLVSNAIKYTRDDGEVRISAEPLAEMIRVSVADTGRGIPSERQSEVFETFNRLGAEALRIEGSGVGLSLTKEFIEKMDGAIGFRSVEGKGSTFWFDLPIVQSDETSNTSASEAKAG